MKYTSPLIIALLLTAFSCKTDKRKQELQKYLIEMNKRGIINEPCDDMDDWTLMHSYKDDEYFFFQTTSKNNDTSLHLDFSFYYKPDSFVIDEYFKHIYWRRYSLLYGINFGHSYLDTLYVRYSHLRDTNHIDTFVVGWYYYQHMIGELTPGQEKFYKKHRDSLAKVRGHDLPPLPEVE